jgi:uncharacterized protein
MAHRTLIDAGPIVAYLNPAEGKLHAWAKEQFRQRPEFYTCEAVMAEVCARLRYHKRDASIPLQLIERGVLILEFELAKSVPRVKRLMEKYADQPMDLADACLVAMSENFDDCELVTTDKTDFSVYRRFGRDVIPTVLPPG